MQNNTLWLIRPIKRMLLIVRHTLAKNGAALRDVYDRIFSFCDCPFLAIVFLRFSALDGMAGRTSWWLKARRNYGQLSVFNLYLALHPDGALLPKCADGIHCMNPA